MNKFSNLRKQAESVLKSMPAYSEPSKEDNSVKILHELGTYLIELELQNKELQESNLKLANEELLHYRHYDIAPVGYITCDQQGLILEVNKTLALMIGLAKGKLLQRVFTDFIVDEDQDVFYLFRQTIAEVNAPQSCELRLYKNNIEPFWVKLDSSFEQPDSTFLIAITDISRLKKVEMELLKSQKNADHANTAKSEILSAMNNDLRTPLNTILGTCQSMVTNEKDPLSLNQHKHVKKIVTDGEQLIELINNIIELEKIEAQKFNSKNIELSLKAISVNTLLTESFMLMQPIVGKHKIQLNRHYYCEEKDELMIDADYLLTKQVLLNLLSNAAKYNHEEGDIHVDCKIENTPMLKISVSDTGKGISKETQQQLFKLFNQLATENTMTQEAGTGLVVCKELIEKMHGKIGFESEVGKGSCFWFELPLSNH